MKTKRITKCLIFFLMSFSCLFLSACGDEENKDSPTETPSALKAPQANCNGESCV